MADFTFTKPTGESYTVSAPTQQQAIDAWTQMQGGQQAEQPPQEDQWRRGVIAPIQKNLETGEFLPAVPQLLQDIWGGMTLPGDVFRGDVKDFDPGRSTKDISDETFQRMIGATAVIQPAALRGITPSQAVVQQMTRPQKTAQQHIARALSDDQVPLEQAQARISQLGPEGRLMDVGPNLQQLGGGAAALPGGARRTLFNTVEQRGKVSAVGPRIQQDIKAAFGTGQPNVVLLDDMINTQRAAAKPLYDAIRGDFVDLTGNIKFVLDTQYGKRAVAAAKNMAQAEGVVFENNRGQMTVAALDMVKQSLDDMVSASYRGSDPKPNQGRIIGNLARQLREAVDVQVPGYRTARDVFSGHAALQDAMDFGRTIFKRETHPATFKTRFDQSTASEREAILNGARTMIEELVGNATNDALMVRNTLKRTYNEQKLELLLGREAVDELIAGIEREMTFGQTANIVAKNAETAQRLAVMGMLDPSAIKAPQGVTILSLIAKGFNAANNKLRGTAVRKANEAMAEMLTSRTFDPSIAPGTAAWRTPNPALPLLTRPTLPVLAGNQQGN